MQLPDIKRTLEPLEKDYRQRRFVQHNPDFEAFLRELKTALDANQLPLRAIEEIFADHDLVKHPDCNGTWAEFGVHTGGTVNATADWRARHCPRGSPPVYGFDTFTGIWAATKQA